MRVRSPVWAGAVPLDGCRIAAGVHPNLPNIRPGPMRRGSGSTMPPRWGVRTARTSASAHGGSAPGIVAADRAGRNRGRWSVAASRRHACRSPLTAGRRRGARAAPERSPRPGEVVHAQVPASLRLVSHSAWVECRSLPLPRLRPRDRLAPAGWQPPPNARPRLHNVRVAPRLGENEATLWFSERRRIESLNGHIRWCKGVSPAAVSNPVDAPHSPLDPPRPPRAREPHRRHRRTSRGAAGPPGPGPRIAATRPPPLAPASCPASGRHGHDLGRAWARPDRPVVRP